MRRCCALLPILLAACPADDAPFSPRPPPPEKATAQRPHSTADTVHLDPGSLRDLRLTTARARRWKATEEISAFAEVIAHEDSEADVAAPFPALVRRLYVPLGRKVRKGQRLATLRSAELGRARADLVAAGARERVAKGWFKRQRNLVTEGIAARRAAERARLDYELAKANRHAARARLAAFGVGLSISGAPAHLGRVTLRAPRGGTVTSRPVRPGAAVSAGHLLYRIADLTRVWLVAHVYEREAARLRVGDRVHAVFPSLPGERLSGAVSVLTGEVNPRTRTMSVRIAVEDKRRRLRPGMSATALITLPVARDPVVTVPLAAVQRVEATWSVFVPISEGRFQRRRVARGRDLGEQVEILKGLRAGEEVVVRGAFLLATESVRSHETGGHHH